MVAIDASPLALVLVLAGAATGVGGDHEGSMDVIKNFWNGTVTAQLIGARAP